MSEIPKSEWGPGEWQDEPDELNWVDPDTNLTCKIMRGPVGSLNGYVGISPAHILYEVDYRQCIRKCDGERGCGHTPEECLSVHGGITYAGWLDKEGPIPLWWFGFDCAHAGDFSPGLIATIRKIHKPESYPMSSFYGDVYRNIEYVKAEVTSLAKQLYDYEFKL